ncbi:MAG: dTDP-4-dehydrorhamnose 3,5-epimerase [Deltaproteobacteria bacterium]|nr:dTDP-4-dehydrorhamnose 3,5-epimerase [Deltaproteobacteria bacterium]MBW1984020.1 dTDP-4-dehydrorhamnose 3,5-epimerase [Deltaproteobacteria bacterium]
MKVKKTNIEDILIIEPNIFKDDRGYFMEMHHQHRYDAFLSNRVFVQDNLSFSKRHALRGLHFQKKHPQAKLIQVISGEIFDVAVDIRQGSPTFGKWTGETLSETNRQQFFIPEGFAHGFCVLSETAHVSYKCTDIFYPEDDSGIVWSDPDIGIDWPITAPILSEKDQNLPTLSSLASEQLPIIDNNK